MKKNKKASQSVGFGIQKDILGEEAVLYLRVANPRRLNARILGEVLVKYLRGGYRTLIISKGKGIQETVSLLDFLGRLQATFNESRCVFLESKLIRESGFRGVI
ncbi:hypothetical protein ABZ353_10825 [Streptomyces niveus]|uniref:hypothetical protein n=1 Tax=Streptomyces niveus TaxID=193462 RepID=UPI0033C63E54